MLLRNNPYFAILCLTAVISGCVAFTAWLRRAAAPSTRPFTWLMVAIALYSASAAVGNAVTGSTAVIFWATAETIIANAVVALFFTFTLYFSRHPHWLTPRRRMTIWLLPIFNMLLVLTNHWHRIVWQDFALMPDGAHVIFYHGTGYLWLAAWFYMYVLTGTLLVARSALHPSKTGTLYRQQALAVIASAMPPLIVGTIHMLELVPPGLSLMPMSFLLTGLIYFTSLFRFRLFDLLPIARDTLVENMSDSVLVLDNENRVVDMNPAAQQFAHRIALEQSPQEIMKRDYWLGQPISRVLGKWPNLLKHCHSRTHTEVLVTISQAPPTHINLRLSLLSDRDQRPTGKLLVLRDMTTMCQGQIELRQINEQQRQTQLALKKANDILESRLRENEALQHQLKELAIRDSLTGLFNRRYFEETLLAEFAKAQRNNTPLAIILVDIDHFKRVNDTYGHQAGDCALQVLANLIQEHVRASDITCRYGGEEFILAMPGMSLEEAYERAERLRVAVKETTIQFKQHVIQTTISGGVGALPEYSGSKDGLVSVVDQALYRAKEEGRDRIQSMQSSLCNQAPSLRSSLQLEKN